MPEAGRRILGALLAAWISGCAVNLYGSGCGFHLAASGSERITIRFELPDWRPEAVDAGGAAMTRIVAACGEDILEPGYPVLPQFKALVALPPTSRITPHWSAANTLRLDLGRIIPAQPAPSLEAGEFDR